MQKVCNKCNDYTWAKIYWKKIKIDRKDSDFTKNLKIHLKTYEVMKTIWSFETNLSSDSDNEEILDIRKIIKSYFPDEYNDEVLIYWKKKEQDSPILSNLASAILVDPDTSISSERLFSNSGFQLWDGKRLSKSNFEKKIFI